MLLDGVYQLISLDKYNQSNTADVHLIKKPPHVSLQIVN